jgi:hypothetical protein
MADVPILRMSTDDVTVGAVVRYPRTGTTGKVVRVEEIDGRQYAEIDSTGLYYRVDELTMPIARPRTRRKEIAPSRNTSRSTGNFRSSSRRFGKRGPTRACEGGG